MKRSIPLTLGLALFLLACMRPAAPVLIYSKYENDDAVPRIKAEEAKKEFDDGNVVFVDSRAEASFKAEHLPGAISIPLGPEAAEKFSQLPKGKKIIVYCT